MTIHPFRNYQICPWCHERVAQMIITRVGSNFFRVDFHHRPRQVTVRYRNRPGRKKKGRPKKWRPYTTTRFWRKGVCSCATLGEARRWTLIMSDPNHWKTVFFSDPDATKKALESGLF